MTNIKNPQAAVTWTETGAEKLVRVTTEMRRQRMAAERSDLQLLAEEGKVSTQAVEFAVLLAKMEVAAKQLGELAATIWELLGAYAM